MRKQPFPVIALASAIVKLGSSVPATATVKSTIISYAM